MKILLGLLTALAVWLVLFWRRPSERGIPDLTGIWTNGDADNPGGVRLHVERQRRRRFSGHLELPDAAGSGTDIIRFSGVVTADGRQVHLSGPKAPLAFGDILSAHQMVLNRLDAKSGEAAWDLTRED